MTDFFAKQRKFRLVQTVPYLKSQAIVFKTFIFYFCWRELGISLTLKSSDVMFTSFCQLCGRHRKQDEQVLSKKTNRKLKSK